MWRRRRRLTDLLTLPQVPTLAYRQARAKALLATGVLAWAQGDFIAGRTFLGESVMLFRLVADQWGLACALRFTTLSERYFAHAVALGEEDTVFCQAPNIIFIALIGAGTPQSSRTVKTKASAREPSQGGASRINLLWLACGLDSPCSAERVPHRRETNVGYAASATTAGSADFGCTCLASNACPFVTTAHATCNNFRAAAHRATFIGFPAARNRS